MPRKQCSHHYIYKTTCTVTGRYYIGMHSTSNLEDDYIGSGKRLWLSIKKHGIENHVREILEFLPDRKALASREKEIVNEELLQDPMCMNINIGGEGGFSSAIQSMNGKKGNEKMNWLRENDPAWKDKNSKNHTKGLINSYINGTREKKLPDWKGKTLSFEHRKKISEINSVMQAGEKNSQFGKVWIYKLNSCIAIKKEELDLYLERGWFRGRKRFKK